jgi:hypothetical protein
MEIKAERRVFTDISTISDVFVNGMLQCLFLEDKVREVPGVPVEQWKVPKLTAIPYGRYKVTYTFSKRFQKVMPEIKNVPGFSGIRIHNGNTAANTDGCPLAGVSELKNFVTHSRIAFAALDHKMKEAFDRGEEIWIEFTDSERKHYA